MTAQQIVIEAPCRVDDMDDQTYHADPVKGGSLSCSWAKKLIQPGGPAKFRWEKDHPPKATKTFDFGHAAHQVVLGTGPEIRVIPEEICASNGATSTNAAKAFIAETYKAGAVPLKADEFTRVQDMALALARTPEAVAVLEAPGVAHEVSAFTKDERTGLMLRCRFDSIAPSVISDYKTSITADPAKLARRTFLDLGYHMQAAWYLDTAAALGLCDGPFKFVVQEKEAPYLVSVVELDDEYLELGRAANRKAIDLYAHCLSTDTWPGYPSHLPPVSPPLWATAELNSVLDPAIEAELLNLLERTHS